MRRFGLIGYPLGHSFSKGYFARKFEREGIADAVYENFELENIETLPRLLTQHTDWAGFNVTIPYKQSVLSYLTEIDEAAEAIGAVNTVLVKGNGLKGYNTDYIGFGDSLVPLLKSHHTKALILGTGGSCKAVAYALEQLGIDYQYVSRSPEANGLHYNDLTRKVMEAHPLIINTTPLGMHPKTGEAPSIPSHYLTPKHLLYDLIYNPAETLFLKRGREHGATTKNGLEMLERQAEASWDIWNKKSAD